MIQLLMLLIVLIILWMLVKALLKMTGKKATLEEARTIGLQEASLHINNPILLEDYAHAKGIPMDVLVSLIEEGKMPFYHWHQFTFVENRELAHARK